MFLCLFASAKIQKKRRKTAFLRNYLFTNHEKGTRDKVNVTQNKEILPPKGGNITYWYSLGG